MTSVAATSAVLAHEVSGGAGAATISALTAAAMGIVLLLIITLVFLRRTTGDNAEPRDETTLP
jgi:hypothetical protein